jgi:ABC-type uncharacterized transport system substrate-binding protein
VTRGLARMALVAALGVGSALPAAAHPHVWADMRSRLVFDGAGLIRGIAVEWTFDKAYTAVAVDGLDTNGDGVYSPDELEPLTKVNLSSLKTYGYFIFVRKDGATQKIGDAMDAGQSYANGRLTLHFTVPLPRPIDPRQDKFMLKVYDPEFFIDFEYQKKDPVAASGAMPRGCRLVLTPIPSDGQLDQTRLMLSTKGVDWKPGDGEDFGSLFAQATLVECGP